MFNNKKRDVKSILTKSESDYKNDEIKSYYAIYQCPMCGKFFRITNNPFSCKRDEFPEIIAKIIKNQQFIGHPLYQAPMNVPHKCNDGNVGIAYLVGFMEDTNA